MRKSRIEHIVIEMVVAIDNEHVQQRACLAIILLRILSPECRKLHVQAHHGRIVRVLVATMSMFQAPMKSICAMGAISLALQTFRVPLQRLPQRRTPARCRHLGCRNIRFP